MGEELIRQELPIQSIRERGDACTATVPIHLSVLSLPLEFRVNRSTISQAKEVVRDWYNQDMEYYLGVLAKDGIELPWLKAYERFSKDWQLDGDPDENGFLRLIWKENGNSHSIQYIHLPVILSNQHNKDGEFITPEFCKEKGWIEVVYRRRTDPEAVNMSPEKMLKYGLKTNSFSIDKGLAEVTASAFCSDYHTNLAKTLLLRDFTVFYLNQLLSIGKNIQQN